MRAAVLALGCFALAGCDFVLKAERECPDSYKAVMNRRFRLDTAETSWVRAAAQCEADAPGLTHMVSPKNLGELDLVISQIEADTWVGVGREPTDGEVSFANFRTVTGEPVGMEMFEAGEPTNNTNEFAAIIMPERFGMFAANILDPRDFICECDGEDVEPFSFQAE
jgi:hypothetical protein